MVTEGYLLFVRQISAISAPKEMTNVKYSNDNCNKFKVTHKLTPFYNEERPNLADYLKIIII